MPEQLLTLDELGHFDRRDLCDITYWGGNQHDRKAEDARDLAYRLYRICDQKKRAQETLGYNALIQSWPKIARLAQESGQVQQSNMFGQE